MLHKNQHNIYEFNALSEYISILHGITVRKHGDMRAVEERHRVLEPYGSVLLTNQIHSAQVVIVHDKDDLYTRNGDALVMTHNTVTQSISEPYLIGVLTADCAPMVFYDPIKAIIAVGHAGWRGTLSGISINIIRAMVLLGSHPKNILVFIGPYIHACCYTITQARAELFEQAFEHANGIISQHGDSWLLDIGRANIQQLISTGVLRKHLHVSRFCTSCRNNEFYSFRKDSAQTFGEMLTFVGFSNAYESK